MGAHVHPTAIIDPSAELADGVLVGPYSVVGPGVVVGEGTRLVSHVVLEGPLRIGRDNQFHPFAVIGGVPQAKRHDGRSSETTIGDRNVFREHVTVHSGANGGATSIGDDNLLMVGCHVAHDVRIGSQVVVANGVQLAGHAVVEDWVTFGGLSGVSQFSRVGESAFVAAGAMCERDVPPFVIVQGDRARVRALNRVGIVRRGLGEVTTRELERVFRAVYGGGRARSLVLAGIASDDPHAAKLLAVLSSAGRT